MNHRIWYHTQPLARDGTTSVLQAYLYKCSSNMVQCDVLNTSVHEISYSTASSWCTEWKEVSTNLLRDSEILNAGNKSVVSHFDRGTVRYRFILWNAGQICCMLKIKNAQKWYVFQNENYSRLTAISLLPAKTKSFLYSQVNSRTVRSKRFFGGQRILCYR